MVTRDSPPMSLRVQNPASPEGATALVTLLASDLVASTRLVEALGDRPSSKLFALHERMARDLMASYDMREIDKADGFLLMFERTTDAVRFALAYHQALEAFSRTHNVALIARVGIHVGEVILRSIDMTDVANGAKSLEVEGLAKPVVARIMSLSLPGQILMTRVAFDIARRAALELPAGVDEIAWLAHGPYVVDGVDEAIDVHEVGIVGRSPLQPPPDSDKAHRVVDPYVIVGWRPAAGSTMPMRPNWILRERVGAGGFGDVWRAEHKKTHEQRVYKFCYDSRALRALKREVTIVRLLKGELGDREDIARIVDWNFELVPYFIECEWTNAGNLEQWAAATGGLAQTPLATRIEIAAQIATALAAAHSVGVLHKDIKASNILVRVGADGIPSAQLTDFGIGLVTDRDLLSKSGITAAGFTDMDSSADGSAAGTRLYQAPELIEGKAPTVQADVYALGVVLYQLVIGDLTRALGSGWERDVHDQLLREDIAATVDRNPDRRIDVHTLASRLRQLDDRRHERRRAELEQEKARRTARRIRWTALVGAAVFLVAVATVIQLRRVAREAERANREAETARRVSAFMVDLFRLADPGESRGNTITAREILDGGARRISAELQDQPEVKAALMTSIGNVYLGLGLPKQAGPLLDTALAIRRRLLGEDAVETADSWYAVGQFAMPAPF